MRKAAISITPFSALFGASLALAGATADVPVEIDFELKAAQGVQTSARFSDNDVEAIGCGARVTDLGDGETFSFGFCQATAASGETIVCTTFSPELVDAINSIANYGFISFSWSDEDECVSVRNSTQSVYIPEFKTKK
jgi:hypothetical protein